MAEQIDLSQVPDRRTIRNSPEERLFAMEVLREALETMPQRQQECLVLMLVGFSEDEIAHRLGLSLEAIQEHLDCAFAKIRAIAGT